MAFKKTDEDAYTADNPLSAAALYAVRRNIEAVMGQIVPGGGCAYDIRNPPILAGDASQGDENFSGESGMAFLVYPQFNSPLNTKVYNLKIRAENPHATLSVFIFTRLMTVSEYISGQYPLAYSRYELLATSEETITINAALTSSPVSTLKTRSDSPYVLLISAASAMGAYQILYDPKMSGDETGLVSINSGNNTVTTAPAALWDGTDAQGDGILPYRLVFGRANTSGTYDPGAFDPDEEFETQDHPPYLHVLGAYGAATATPHLSVYPGVTATHTAATTDAMSRQSMGFARIYGIWLNEYAVNPADLNSNSLAHGQTASAGVVGALHTTMTNLVAYGCPPLAIDTDVSRINDVFSVFPASQRQTIATVGKTFTTAAEWVVGGPRFQFRSAEEDTATSVRNTYQVDMLLSWQMYHNSAAADLNASLVFRAVIEDGGGDIIGDEEVYTLSIIPSLIVRDGAVITQRADYLQGYLLGYNLADEYLYRSQHSLRDVLPFSAVNTLSPHGLRATLVRVIVQDSGSVFQTTARRLRVEAKINAEMALPPGAARFGQHTLCVWAANVSYVRSTDPTALGDY